MFRPAAETKKKGFKNGFLFVGAHGLRSALNGRATRENNQSNYLDRGIDSKEATTWNIKVWIPHHSHFLKTTKQTKYIIIVRKMNKIEAHEKKSKHTTGQNIYAVTVKLPLGTYVYRFLIDGEEWETNLGEAKAIRDGFEYNTITVKGVRNFHFEDEEAQEENKEDVNEQMLTYDESTGGFVVGKGKKRKRRGRPSIEIELPSNFVEAAPSEPQQQQATTTEPSESVAEKQSEGAEKSKSRKKKKGKMRGFGMARNDVDVK
ncbi:hypothetical protein RFI_05477 [Reticulomyxa filosa]|uniref:AMP-activated protein kinase glycogen-binding domain-containing protein n=1 Tax=Reticulomyxa filosa TaxID=46433 RepID=X6P072_RETFI|nr:hypothetical protein RFI_05477 [Reticulomyxa filosa]|eukprot:ETO31641.1 hypothetical protein RFI_05477 [Reticulomyxa filosa]